MKLGKLTWIAGSFIAMTALVAGCSDDSARQASSPLDDQEVGALFGTGTNVCIENKSSKSIPITIRRADTSDGSNPLLPGGLFCAEGTFTGGQDIVLKLDLGAGNRAMWINATNQSLISPRFYLTQETSSGGRRNCIYQGFSEQEEVTTTDAILEYRVERLTDTNWKEFLVTVKDSPRSQVANVQAACDMV